MVRVKYTSWPPDSQQGGRSGLKSLGRHRWPTIPLTRSRHFLRIIYLAPLPEPNKHPFHGGNVRRNQTWNTAWPEGPWGHIRQPISPLRYQVRSGSMLGGYLYYFDLAFYHYYSMYSSQMQLLEGLLRTDCIWAGLHCNIPNSRNGMHVPIASLCLTLLSFLRRNNGRVDCQYIHQIQPFMYLWFSLVRYFTL